MNPMGSKSTPWLKLGHPMSNPDIPNASKVMQRILKEARRHPESVQGPPKRPQRL